MRTIQCMDGGRCFSRAVHFNTFRNQAIYASKPYCRTFLLFGAWHIVMPIRGHANGEMPFAAMALMGIGYIILSGIKGIRQGIYGQGLATICSIILLLQIYCMLFSLKGADELQIVRIMAAQMVSFAFVLIIYYQAQKRESINPWFYRGPFPPISKKRTPITLARPSGRSLFDHFLWKPAYWSTSTTFRPL